MIKRVLINRLPFLTFLFPFQTRTMRTSFATPITASCSREQNRPSLSRTTHARTTFIFGALTKSPVRRTKASAFYRRNNANNVGMAFILFPVISSFPPFLIILRFPFLRQLLTNRRTTFFHMNGKY